MRLGRVPAVPVLGHVLPGQPAARLAASRSRCSRRCGTASSCAATPTTGLVRRRPVGGRPRRGPASCVIAAGLLVGRAHASTGGVDARDRRRVAVTDAPAPPSAAAAACRCAVVERNTHRVPAHVVRLPHRARRAAAVPAVDRHRRRRARRQGAGPGRRAGRRTTTFVAPGLLAAAAMNGAVLDTTFNFFFKFKYAHTYDAMLATPLGVRRRRVRRDDVGAAARRDLLDRVPRHDGCRRAGRVVVGAARGARRRCSSAFAFAGAGIGGDDVHAVVDRLRLREPRADPDVPVLGDVLPAVAVPGRGCRWVVRCTPLYQGVVLERGLVLGQLEWTMLLQRRSTSSSWAAVGLRIATRRLQVLLQP